MRAVTREVPVRDPLAWFAAGAGEGEGFYWERPDAGLALAACGCVAALEAAGPDRFARLDAGSRRLLGEIEAEGDAPAGVGARLVGGFAFGDAAPGPGWRGFPAARFVLPARLLVVRGGRCFLTTCGSAPASAPARRAPSDLEACDQAARVGMSADRSARRYLRSVEAALRAIGRGDLEKVVLARSVRVEAMRDYDVPGLLAGLRATHPGATTFAVARGGAAFLGATPERLVSLDGRSVETAALAGTRPRGRNPEEDARLARQLVESKKEQAEHAVVVRALRAALDPCCRRLDLPEAPRLRSLDGVQHLETPLVGELREPLGIFALAGRLHPTPAVGGAPSAAAVRWIAAHEGLDRGWYGGAVGHVGPEGGDLAVALRSALLRGGCASCFAGAGIVAGSSPAAEWNETRWKLRTLLSPLLEL
ncbi:MAG: isochorismate synthase [Myxococcota bacterium]